MKHIKTWIIPDCPKCGHELKGTFRYDTKKATRQKPYGIPVGWWYCDVCGYRTEETEGKPNDNIIVSEVTVDEGTK